MHYAGREEEAGPSLRFLLDSASELTPSQVAGVMGLLGVTAARRGDRDEAMRWSDEFTGITNPCIRGANKLWQARIAATLGDRDVAVNLLRDAFREGSYITRAIFDCDMDLDSLRDYQPFIDLIRPR